MPWLSTFLRGRWSLCAGVSAKSFYKGVETWKKETVTKMNLLDASTDLQSNGEGSEAVDAKYIPGGPSNSIATRAKVSVLNNVCWKKLGVIVAVWLMILALQIAKNYVTRCSVKYWLIELLQIPVAVGVTSYQAMNLYKGRSVIASKGEANMKWLSSWYAWWITWSWWSISIGSDIFGDGNPSSGIKCYSHLCHDILFIHLCCRILPPKTLSNSLCSLPRSCDYCFSICGATCGRKGG